jgi:hypothetical protein
MNGMIVTVLGMIVTVLMNMTLEPKVCWLDSWSVRIENCSKGAAMQFSFPRDRWFESTSLQRGVLCKPD